MINLLPPAMKQSYRYAERNIGLVKWVMAGLIAVVGVGGLATYGWLSLHQSINSYNGQVASIQATLQKEKLKQTNQQVKDITNSFRLADQVLSQEVLFSKLLKQMATALPTGARLTGLDIAQISGGAGLDVSAEATNSNVAAQVQVNLADPSNQIFAKADIQNITCDAKQATDPNYPCKISLRAQFAQNNPFLFINQKGPKS